MVRKREVVVFLLLLLLLLWHKVMILLRSWRLGSCGFQMSMPACCMQRRQLGKGNKASLVKGVRAILLWVSGLWVVWFCVLEVGKGRGDG